MKKKVTILLTIIFTLISIYCIYKIFNWHKDNLHIKDLTDNIINETIINNINNEDENNQEKEEFKIDFDKLKKDNNDTKGWIQVNNTNINYPVVQYRNNDYYLTHSFDKKYTDAGWVFLDYRNNIDDFDKNTIIYGHARLDRTMFGTLKNILKKDWYTNKNNQIIKLYTLNEYTEWQVFSVYHIETENYYITTEFTNDEFKKFIKVLKNRSIYNFNVEVNENDKILTLSTCHLKNEKIVLHAKLIKKEVID